MANKKELVDRYIIEGEHLRGILDHLKNFPYGDVHMVMLCLEQLEQMSIEVHENPDTDAEKELLLE